jgi:protein-tyrosine-phosphatase
MFARPANRIVLTARLRKAAVTRPGQETRPGPRRPRPAHPRPGRAALPHPRHCRRPRPDHQPGPAGQRLPAHRHRHRPGRPAHPDLVVQPDRHRRRSRRRRLVRPAELVRTRSEGDRRRTCLRLASDALASLQPPSLRDVPRVVFVCTHKSARSQLAAALWADRADIPAASAGTRPADRVHPRAVACRHGLIIDATGTAHVADVVTDADLVVAVCDNAHEDLTAGARPPAALVHPGTRGHRRRVRGHLHRPRRTDRPPRQHRRLDSRHHRRLTTGPARPGLIRRRRAFRRSDGGRLGGPGRPRPPAPRERRPQAARPGGPTASPGTGRGRAS